MIISLVTALHSAVAVDESQIIARYLWCCRFCYSWVAFYGGDGREVVVRNFKHCYLTYRRDDVPKPPSDQGDQNRH